RAYYLGCADRGRVSSACRHGLSPRWRSVNVGVPLAVPSRVRRTSFLHTTVGRVSTRRRCASQLGTKRARIRLVARIIIRRRRSSVTSASIRCWIAASIATLGFVQVAHAELPQLDPVQMLGPDSTDASDNPNQVPSPPFFGAGVALQGNVALAGMPAAWDEKGRVAAFVRTAAGRWIRTQTLTASNG